MIRDCLALAAFSLIASIGNCSGGSHSLNLDYYMSISDNWVDSNNSNHSFQLFSDDNGKRAGSFTGEERFNGSHYNDVSGTWSKNSLTLVIDPNGSATQFTGPITSNNTNTLVLKSSGASLTLIRNR